MPLKNVSGQSYKVTIRTLGSSLVQTKRLYFIKSHVHVGIVQGYQTILFELVLFQLDNIPIIQYSSECKNIHFPWVVIYFL